MTQSLLLALIEFGDDMTFCRALDQGAPLTPLVFEAATRPALDNSRNARILLELVKRKCPGSAGYKRLGEVKKFLAGYLWV